MRDRDRRLSIATISNNTGSTPLIKISNKIYAKLETFNPSGSIKDRMISYVIRRALIFGEIKKDTILCDATSGNTGISLSMCAAALGLECVIFMPKNMTEERKKMMTIYGAKIIDAPDDDFKAAIFMRDQYLRANERAWSPKQFSNSQNILCHKNTTAPEIHKQVIDIKQPWSAFIHGCGTGGTLEGVRKYLLINDMKTKICMVQPSSSPHGIQGIGDGGDFLFKSENADRILQISTEDAITRATQFCQTSGLLVGISSGANILASERYVESNPVKGIVVTILCDRGERYLTTY